jgi:DNA repair protein RadA
LLEPGILKGVSTTTIAKLRRAGYTTIEAVAFAPVKELAKRGEMGADTAFKANMLARELVDPGYVSALEILERRKNMKKCTTGSMLLNSILGGGIETGAITEFIGEYGTGKTQICYTLSVTAQRPVVEGGLDGKVAVIDTEGTFIPKRITQIAEARGYDPQEVLKNILIARAYNSDHQIILIENLPELCYEKGIKLVIVDSMIGHFRGEYIGRENLSERQQKLGRCLHSLLRLAEAFNLSVVITNQVQATPSVAYGDPNKPTGGHVMAHACTHRVYIRKGKGNTRLARVIDSPSLPEVKVRIALTEKGVEDAEKQ